MTIVLALAALMLPACADKGFCESASADFYSGGSSGQGGSSGSSISDDLSALLSTPDSGSQSVDVAAWLDSLPVGRKGPTINDLIEASPDYQTWLKNGEGSA